MRAGRWLTCLLLAVAAGCAVIDDRTTAPADWASHRDSLLELYAWTATGKVALRSRDSAESATIIWRQQATESWVRLSGPFGAATTNLYSDGRSLTVQQGEEQRTVDISTPGQVLLNTGWDLPLQAQPHWLRGQPDPDSEVQELGIDPASGHLASLRQQGWQVRYSQYRLNGDVTLPSRLVLEKDDTRATLLIRRWQTGSD
ncbi:MAG: lipoprotein insertase outer membrane protein LolB [Halioglobus sp.]|nr:lipoprotein insertase outer membrane protein LolB [Halioglobus sp.]